MSSRTERKHFDKRPVRKRREAAIQVEDEENKDEIRLALKLGSVYTEEEQDSGNQ
jgi:hypothetical protein